jgi:hypothetical protein
MRKTIFVSCLLLFTLALASHTLAQDEPKPAEAAKAPEAPARFYHLELVVQELGKDGKPTNSRTYTITVRTESHNPAAIRTNSRIPIVTGSFSSGPENSAPVQTQIQYQDVGVNIDVHSAQEVGRQLSLDLQAEISSVAENPDTRVHQPIIRQNRWQAAVLIPIGKPTVVFTSDALDSKGSMQLVVTATPVQ